MSNAVRAYAGEDSGTTIYEFSDGKKEKWIGGSRAWRNNNPGNLRPSKLHAGQIGINDNFAIFPDRDTGKAAIRPQLRRPLYNNLSLERAVTQYAPKADGNPTENYINYVSKKAEISRKAILRDLSDTELLRMVDAMISFEHTIEGRIEVISPGKTGRYIWHTVHDEKVRGSHAARDGKIFDFANPPPGGNPGDDYNFRCWAEPITEQAPAKPLKQIFGK